jgi:nitrogen fixation NifU-like protein
MSSESESDGALAENREDLWADCTEAVIDHAQNPRNVGSIPNSDGFGSVIGLCGDTMGVWLRVDNELIADITFWTDGCGTTIAAGSMVTELAKGKAVVEAASIRKQTVLDALGGLPEDSAHCAQLAADTLRQAINDYLSFRREPWKRPYRKVVESNERRP